MTGNTLVCIAKAVGWGRLQAECLAADRVKVGQLCEDVIRELRAMLAYRFEDFCTKLVLDVRMFGEQVKSAGERVRRRVHAREDERPARSSVSV